MSQLHRVKITALGTYVPPRLLTNKDLEKMVETTDEWIMSRVGIRERHIVDKGVGTSDLAVEAAKIALAQRGLTPDDIDLLIVGTVTPDMMFPSTACLVQHKLGAKKMWGFDILAACSSFVYSLQMGVQFVATGAHKRVLVVGADVMSSIIDYTDRATCVIFGDGAGAVILERAEDAAADDMSVPGFIDFEHRIDGSGGTALYMPGGGSLNPSTHETVDKKMHYVHQEGGAVFKFAVRNMAEVCETLLTRNGLKGKDIDVFIGNWMPSMEADIKDYAADGSVEVVGANLPTGAFYTLAVPEYTWNKGLKDFKDIAKFKDSLKAKFIGIESGNDGNRHILDMIKDPKFNLAGFELIESSEAGMLSEVAKDYQNKEDVVFLGWAPHPMNTTFKMKYLTGGDDLFGPNMGAAVVNSTVRKGYLAECPNVGKLVKQLKFDVGMENEMMDQILNKSADPKVEAIAYVKAHPDLLKPWLDGVTTFDGKGPALDAVKAVFMK